MLAWKILDIFQKAGWHGEAKVYALQRNVIFTVHLDPDPQLNLHGWTIAPIDISRTPHGWKHLPMRIVLHNHVKCDSVGRLLRVVQWVVAQSICKLYAVVALTVFIIWVLTSSRGSQQLHPLPEWHPLSRLWRLMIPSGDYDYIHSIPYYGMIPMAWVLSILYALQPYVLQSIIHNESKLTSDLYHCVN